jgi:hypothetical protein
MHALGNFNADGEAKRPFITVIPLNGAQDIALIQEAEDTIQYVRYKQKILQTHALIESATASATRPQSGGGIIRRTISLELKTDSANGLAFFKGNITKKLYRGGQTFNEATFAVYACDASKFVEDIEKSWFLGIYRIDNSIEWQEESGTTELVRACVRVRLNVQEQSNDV